MQVPDQEKRNIEFARLDKAILREAEYCAAKAYGSLCKAQETYRVALEEFERLKREIVIAPD